MKKFIKAAVLSVVLAVAVPATAFAHVVVTPGRAGVGTSTTFSVSVPNEKEVAVTGLTLTLPAGLKEVMPTVHPGWTITKTDTEISWSNGTIPARQRDDLTFRAETPAKAGTLIWKVVQTYADGTSVAWDQKPAPQESESETSGPYSVTTIVDDIAVKQPAEESNDAMLPLATSLVALVLSTVALVRKSK